MESAASMHIPMAMVNKGATCPDFWDSPSFAHSLQWAFEGFPGDSRLAGPGQVLLSKMKTCNGEIPPEPGCGFFKTLPSLQKKVYNILRGEVFPDSGLNDLINLLQQRLSIIFQPFVLDFENTIDLSDLISRLKPVGPNGVSKILKTWLNGWVTSYRMHEGTLHQCLLGCHDGRDSLNHYVQCPHIYALIKFLHGCPADPLQRLALIQPNEEQLKIVCCMFSGYHAIKGLVRSGKFNLRDIDNQAPSFLRESWSVFAQTFCSEAVMYGLNTRAFSLPCFLNFIANGGFFQAAIAAVPVNLMPAVHEHYEAM